MEETNMMEAVITRLVDDGIAETVARALEDFKGMVVTITIQERKPNTKKGEVNHGSRRENFYSSPKRWQTLTVEVEAVSAAKAKDIAFEMYAADAGDIDWEPEEYDFAIENVEEVEER
jgi:hypothetical protein